MSDQKYTNLYFHTDYNLDYTIILLYDYIYRQRTQCNDNNKIDQTYLIWKTIKQIDLLNDIYQMKYRIVLVCVLLIVVSRSNGMCW